jgi:hypothetical protein
MLDKTTQDKLQTQDMSKVMNYSAKYLQDTDSEQRLQKDNVSSLQQNETKHKTILRG